MSFKISLESSESLEELVKRTSAGGAVLRTPHVGNLYGNNLGLAALGLRLLMYDRTLGTRDLNYHPHLVVSGGTAEQISEPTIMTSHALVNRGARIGSRLVDLHLSPLRKAHPDQEFLTWSDYLARHHQIILPILTIVTQKTPSIWTRRVDEHGYTTRGTLHSWLDLDRDGIFALTSQNAGWLIPNELNVLLTCIVESVTRGVGEVVMLAGPDMARYISSYQSLLDHLYGFIHVKFPMWHLPLNLKCLVLPVHQARFQMCNEHRPILNNLVELYQRFQISAGRIREYVAECKSGKVDMQALIVQKQRSICELHEFMRIYQKPLAQQVFYKISIPNYLSQHDLHQTKGISVHPWSVGRPLRELDIAFSVMKRHFDYVVKNPKFKNKTDISTTSSALKNADSPYRARV